MKGRAYVRAPTPSSRRHWSYRRRRRSLPASSSVNAAGSRRIASAVQCVKVSRGARLQSRAVHCLPFKPGCCCDQLAVHRSARKCFRRAFGPEGVFELRPASTMPWLRPRCEVTDARLKRGEGVLAVGEAQPCVTQNTRRGRRENLASVARRNCSAPEVIFVSTPTNPSCAKTRHCCTATASMARELVADPRNFTAQHRGRSSGPTATDGSARSVVVSSVVGNAARGLRQPHRVKVFANVAARAYLRNRARSHGQRFGKVMPPFGVRLPAWLRFIPRQVQGTRLLGASVVRDREHPRRSKPDISTIGIPGPGCAAPPAR